jgi:hypothetical protein
MGRFNKNMSQERSKPRPWQIHPVWQGIGCLLVVIVPVMSFISAYLINRENFKQGWVSLPPEMLKSFIIPNLGSIYVVDIILTLLIIFLGFGLLSVIYSIIYRLIGPPRYSPLDAQPPRAWKKRWK